MERDDPANDRDHRLDEIDSRSIHAMKADERGVSAPTSAETVNVSAATVRNRISKHEATDEVAGHHARDVPRRRQRQRMNSTL